MIAIRAARDEDADALPEIERASDELFRAWPGLEWIAGGEVQSVARHRELIAHGVALVAVDTARPTAFLSAELTDDHALHIWQIAVDPAHQRQGIGRRMIVAAEEAARARGASVLTLTTFRDVPWNAPYYARLGFRLLTEEELSPRLRDLLDAEATAGLPRSMRCAMTLPL